ncbi:Os05g0399300 [Oryza sativa Japonica Group]|nr:Os05g0399300 [Oryza sativa Japonica Group]|eukprot:NP_001055476.1 Os05g0399300 [Oryza sativa Japonica Group]
MSTPRAAASLAKKAALVALAVLAAALATAARAEQCGAQAGGARCPNCLCCSRWGWCGTTSDFCGDGCQSQCSGCGPTPTPPSPSDGVGSIVPRDLFERLLLHRNDGACPARGFYTYEAFLAAAAAFPAFGGTGNTETRKREVAAFLGQTSHETTGGWPTAPDGPFSWGYCFKQEQNPPSDYCQPSPEWPCAPGRKYYGRGPIQLSFNFNYGPAGRAIGVDLLSNPDLVATDATVSFKTALWFWMTPQGNKPSSHDVITGRWAPSPADAAAGRAPGYGVITNIVNGGLECGHGPDDRVANRIGFYQRYCGAFGIGTGGNLDCYNQRPFNSGSSVGLAEQ